MATLFCAVVPNSECEKTIQRMIKVFSPGCPSESKELSEERDTNYYKLDCNNYPSLAEMLYDNLVHGAYASLGSFVMLNELSRSVYGYRRAYVATDDNFTLEDFINA